MLSFQWDQFDLFEQIGSDFRPERLAPSLPGYTAPQEQLERVLGQVATAKLVGVQTAVQGAGIAIPAVAFGKDGPTIDAISFSALLEQTGLTAEDPIFIKLTGAEGD